mgnify:CR=1 FL=1
MTDELDEGLLVAIVVTVVVVLVIAYRLTTGGRKRTFQQTVAEVEESTPLIDNEAQQYINKLRKEMGSAGIQLGGEFEYRMAQAHVKAKRQKEAQAGSIVRQRSGRDPRTA